MPLARLKPAGTAALPLALTASVVLVESKVPSELEQLLVVQTSKVTLPVSWVSGSLNVAVSVGVAVLSRAVSAGLTSAGVEGATFVRVVRDRGVGERGGRGRVAGGERGVADHRVAARLGVGERERVEVVDGARERELGLVGGRVADRGRGACDRRRRRSGRSRRREPGTACVWSRFSDQVIVTVVPFAATVAELIVGAVVSTMNDWIALNDEEAAELSTFLARQ